MEENDPQRCLTAMNDRLLSPSHSFTALDLPHPPQPNHILSGPSHHDYNPYTHGTGQYQAANANEITHYSHSTLPRQVSDLSEVPQGHSLVAYARLNETMTQYSAGTTHRPSCGANDQFCQEGSMLPDTPDWADNDDINSQSVFFHSHPNFHTATPQMNASAPAHIPRGFLSHMLHLPSSSNLGLSEDSLLSGTSEATHLSPNLANHNSELPEPNGKHACPNGCGGMFGRPKDGIRHVSSGACPRAPGSGRHHICATCGKAFNRKDVLSRHERKVHKIVRPGRAKRSV